MHSSGECGRSLELRCSDEVSPRADNVMRRSALPFDGPRGMKVFSPSRSKRARGLARPLGAAARRRHEQRNIRFTVGYRRHGA